jgi:hypothetical protein
LGNNGAKPGMARGEIAIGGYIQRSAGHSRVAGRRLNPGECCLDPGNCALRSISIHRPLAIAKPPFGKTLAESLVNHSRFAAWDRAGRSG